MGEEDGKRRGISNVQGEENIPLEMDVIFLLGDAEVSMVAGMEQRLLRLRRGQQVHPHELRTLAARLGLLNVPPISRVGQAGFQGFAGWENPAT